MQDLWDVCRWIGSLMTLIWLQNQLRCAIKNIPITNHVSRVDMTNFPVVYYSDGSAYVQADAYEICQMETFLNDPDKIRWKFLV